MIITTSEDKFIIDDFEFIKTLKQSCLEKGMNLFREAKISGEDLMTNCPFHAHGQERRPSFGISLNKGVVHCLACGYSGSIPVMISNIFGVEDYGLYGERWLSHYFSGFVRESRQVFPEFGSNSIDKTAYNAIKQEKIDEYAYYHPYMYKRGLNDKIIQEFNIGYDASTDCITFPVYNHDGSFAFIARRSVKGKFFNYPKGVEKPVYAAERFASGKYKYAVLVESFFNCLTFWRYGYPSMALLGTGTSFQYSILKKLPVRKYILALDPDTAGDKGRLKLRKALQDSKIITEFFFPKNKDANDLGEKVQYLQEYW